MIASDSRLDTVTLMVTRLKELECYDVLGLVIKRIWLSPDSDVLPSHLRGWVDLETSGCSEYRPTQAWSCSRGMNLRRVIHPPPPARQHDRQLTAQESGSGSVYTGHDFEVRQPQHWKIRQTCVVKRLCQVLGREMELEGLDVLDLLQIVSNDAGLISSTDHRSTIQDSSESDWLS